MVNKYMEDDARLIALLELLKSSYWYAKELKEVFKPFDISHEQFNILRILEYNQKRKFSLKEIQSRILNKTENTTRLVEKLKLKGFIRSEYSLTNRRTLEIQLTKDGLQLLDRIKSPLFAFSKRINKKLVINDSKELIRILRKMRSA